MVPEFRPNGCQGFTQSRSYFRSRRILHHSLASMIAKGRALAVPYDDLTAAEVATLHFSELVHAPKPYSKGVGRTCLHLSRQCNPAFLPVNQAVDKAACDAVNPALPLPTLADFAGIARAQRDAAPGGDIEAAFLDLTSAFQLVTLDSASARLTCTLLHVPRPGREDLRVVLIWLCAEWGQTRTSFAFNILGRAIPYVLNRALPLPVAAIYVDDMPFFAARGQVCAHLVRACEIAVTIFGPECLTFDDPSITSHFDPAHPFTFHLSDHHRVRGPKIAYRDRLHEAIGFTFDLARWRVFPRRLAIVKMFHLLWRALPHAALRPGAITRLPTRLVTTLASVLNFYSVALPSGNACVRALFACLRGPGARLTLLSEAAKRDLAWWRVVIRDVLVQPHRLARDLDTMGPRPLVHFTLITDASTGVGGGGWLAPPQMSRSDIEGVTTIAALLASHRLYRDRSPGPGTSTLGALAEAGDHLVPVRRGADAALRSVLSPAWDDLSSADVAALDRALELPPTAIGPFDPPAGGTHDHDDLCARLSPLAVVLRWTAEEQSGFELAAIGINVLEFFTAAYLIILWGPSLRGTTLGVLVDNTAALSWLASGRYSGTSSAGQDLVRILYLFCLDAHITLVPSHIAGVRNTLADNLSRSVFLQELPHHPPSPPSPVGTADAQWWATMSRAQISRRLLTRACAMQSAMPPQNLLSVVSSLR